MNVKKLFLPLAYLIILFSMFGSGIVQAQSDAEIIYYYGQGCPHCADVAEFFDDNDIEENYPIVKKEIYFNDQNVREFNQMMTDLGIPVAERGVPTLVIGNSVLRGDVAIIDDFTDLADAYLASQADPDSSPDQSVPEGQSVEEGVNIGLIIGAALVDAINPCAFAVLIILMSTILAKKDRRKALYSGLAFSAVVFVSYTMMGLGVYSALGTLSSTNVLNTVVGVFAIVLGLFNLKDFFWYGKAFVVEVPRSWRPKMKSIIASVTNPWGAAGAALLVSLFLLPCTSGPYLVVLGLLAENPLDISALAYLLLYNLIFVAPMVLITVLAYRGLDIEKLEYNRQANLERLHLAAGVILIALGVFILI